MTFQPSDVVRDNAVHGKIYTDEHIFGLEMERIFQNTWVYLAHESEIANTGDYKTASIGLQPVIVTRGSDDGTVRALLNRCRHRAASVCQSDCGNANFFRCAYHGWTYSNTGELIGVPFGDGYGPEFDKKAMGLLRVPRVESYRGFVFASMNPDVRPLEEHLGLAKPYIDFVVDADPEGISLTAGAQRYVTNANWKFQLENTLDPYHASITHQSFFEMLGRRIGKKFNYKKQYEQERVEDLGNGHAIYHMQADMGIGETPFILTIFPNLGILGSHIRVIQPVSVLQTQVSLYPMLLKSAPKERNAARLRNHEIFYGPAGQGTADDLEVAFDRVREGLAADAADPWLLLSRGLHRETAGERGSVVSHPTDELSFRSIYKAWTTLMSAGPAAVGADAEGRGS